VVNGHANSYTASSARPTAALTHYDANLSGSHVGAMTHGASSQRADNAMRQLQQRHDREKQLFDEEIARLAEAMRRRQQLEAETLSDRLQRESHHLQEYEEARLRMERAREELEALNATPSVLDMDVGHDGPPELRALKTQY
jgi:DNA repair exonuclease SbcCD ATPase subunit